MLKPFRVDAILPADATATSLRTMLWRILPWPEFLLAGLFVAIGMVIGWSHKLPMQVPDSASLAFTGLSNQAAIFIVASAILITFLTQTLRRALYLVTSLVAYSAILITHFNLKLWVHVINVNQWDKAFWTSDQAMRPLVDGALSIHRGLASAVGPIDRLYLFAFLAMFVCSITVHCSRCFPVFRKVVLTSMTVHVLGGFAYLVMPALGPFIFEPGPNALETERQIYMLAAHNNALAGGLGWFQAHGAKFLATGLAAMPSLHVASSAVFVYYALRYERILGWFYVPLFLFIMSEAVATRWHYVVDIFGGLVLTTVAVICIETFYARWIAGSKEEQLT